MTTKTQPNKINREAGQRIWEANDLLDDAVNAIGEQRKELLFAAWSVYNEVLGGNRETLTALDAFQARWFSLYKETVEAAS